MQPPGVFTGLRIEISSFSGISARIVVTVSVRVEGLLAGVQCAHGLLAQCLAIAQIGRPAGQTGQVNVATRISGEDILHRQN
jgi:hypothetical protein